jgi:signal transduction histidine kinase
MNWHYTYTPYIWPMLASALLFCILGLYAWRRRTMAGALPFALMLLFMLLWSLGATFQLASADIPTKIFWFKFTSIMKLPAATAELCFGLQYTGLGRFLTRRNVLLLALPALLVLLLVLIDGTYHVLWVGFHFDGSLHPVRSELTLIIAIYSFLLALTMLVILVWLFVHSPQQRWPLALIMVELLIARWAVLLDYMDRNPVAPIDPVVLAWNAGAILYAGALFGFRIFDPIPLANQMAIAQMREGMVVLDSSGQVVRANPAAQAILGASGRHLLASPIQSLLPEYPALAQQPPGKGLDQIEVQRGIQGEIRQYLLEDSALKDWRGLVIGRMLLLHDVTEQRRAQATLVEQQRALATLQERERLARELHDSIGQILAYAGFQVEAASKLVSDGQTNAATAQLGRLAGIVREAHADVREYILDLRAAPAPQQPFFTTLRHYLEGFTDNYNIQTVLRVDEHLNDEPFTPEARMQVFRILQEALSNARKHSQAHCIQVIFATENHQVCITVQDDGTGFDPLQSAAKGQSHFGLQFMRERVEALGGCLEVISQPNQGTRVVARAPMNVIHLTRESESDHA